MVDEVKHLLTKILQLVRKNKIMELQHYQLIAPNRLMDSETYIKKKIQPWLVWLSWLEHTQKGGRFSSQSGTYLGCGFGPHVRACTAGNKPINVSLWHLLLSLFLSLSPPSLKINEKKCLQVRIKINK